MLRQTYAPVGRHALAEPAGAVGQAPVVVVGIDAQQPEILVMREEPVSLGQVAGRANDRPVAPVGRESVDKSPVSAVKAEDVEQLVEAAIERRAEAVAVDRPALEPAEAPVLIPAKWLYVAEDARQPRHKAVDVGHAHRARIKEVCPPAPSHLVDASHDIAPAQAVVSHILAGTVVAMNARPNMFSSHGSASAAVS